MFSAFVLNLVTVFWIFVLLAGPLLVFLGFVYPVMAFSPEATLLESLMFPVIGAFLLVLAVGGIVKMPKVMHHDWFAAACAFHLYCGVANITSENYIVISVGLLFLVYSVWEFFVFCRSAFPPPATPL